MCVCVCVCVYAGACVLSCVCVCVCVCVCMRGHVCLVAQLCPTLCDLGPYTGGMES